VAQDYIADTVRGWVWSGFYSMADIREMLPDIVEEERDEERGLALAAAEYREKEEDEAVWPQQTDCDRLDVAFEDLWAQGVVALHNAGYTMSDGLDDVAEAAAEQGDANHWGYCFYHGQDVERAVASGDLMLAFGDLNPDDRRKAEAGRVVLAALRSKGLAASWDGDAEKRIQVSLQWKRRLATK
jgi:uncharacterized protein DUF6891